MRLVFFAGLFLMSDLLSAQTDFLKDPDIVWAAEIEQDWVVDIPSFEEEWEQGLITLKQLRSREHELHYSSPYLIELVIDAVNNRKLKVYKDSDLKIPEADYWANKGQGMSVIFDPLTLDEKVVTTFNTLDPFVAVKAWRLRQILAYHKKKATWSTTVLAIAPLVQEKNWETDCTQLRPLFWFKPAQKCPKLTSNHIVWAKKTFSGQQSGTAVSHAPSALLKTMKDGETPISHILQVFETDMKSPFYDSQGNELLSPKERRNMVSRTDTIATFDPETYETAIEIINKGIKSAQISQLRLVQTWYWDARRNQLSICLDAVAPIKNVIDDWGGFRYAVPLFYRKAKP
jgi:hypothetical protein